MKQADRYKQAKKATLLSAIINILLGFMKLFAGIMFQSHALVADGIHSFSDLFTDILVIFASKYGSQDADSSHPYGHQRIETAATLLLAMLLILAGAGIAWDSLDEMIYHTVHQTKFLALPVAIISILVNESLFHYTRYIGNLIQSPLLCANAWHHRSDAAASAIVLIGLTGNLLGVKLLDPIAAVVIGAMIIKMGIDYAWNSVKELVDTGLEPQKVAEIDTIIRQVNGVKKIHQLRHRMMGKDIFIDVHILVSPTISVSEGHYIAQHVHHDLVTKVQQIKDVTVHVDPEDDELKAPCLHLKNRQVWEETLLNSWQQKFPDIQSWLLHYLDGKIIIDLITNDAFKQEHGLKTQIEQDIQPYAEISLVNVLKHSLTITQV